ncbi:hypothetical protein ACHAWC_001739, partial [Mediolabrus comicus]
MCNKCNGVNSNDGSMCINLVEGKVCAASKPWDGNNLGWGDCFKKQPQQRDQGEWICAVCRLKMSKDDTKCIACETLKPEISTVALAENVDE